MTKFDQIIFRLSGALLLVFALVSCSPGKGGAAASLLSALGVSGNAATPGAASGPPGTLHLTFHDTPIQKGAISKININVLRTELVDFADQKITISTTPIAMDLLQTTQNNPVILAHGDVPSGTYKQIRLILDDSSTIVLADNSSYPLKVPSGQQSGIKINGIFTVPAGEFYTLDIDLDPNQSVHYTNGQGYMLKPTIALTGSNVLYWDFFYSGNFNNRPFIVAISSDTSMRAIWGEHPELIVAGSYIYDGLTHQFTLTPQSISCPSCGDTALPPLSSFGAGIGSPRTFSVITFAQNYIDVVGVDGSILHLNRSQEFTLGQAPPVKEIVLSVEVSDATWAGKWMATKLFPEDGSGAGFSSVVQIGNDLRATLHFRIPLSEWVAGDIRNYDMVNAIVPSDGDVTFDSDLIITQVRNLVAVNHEHAFGFTIHRDTPTVVPAPVLQFVPDGP